MILLIDNYDSFVQNLARYLRRLGQETRVVRNDQMTVGDVQRWQPDALVISPGPCTPREAGQSLPLVEALHATMPILGVCLGHQVIAEAFGGHVVRAREPVHGRASLIHHVEQGVFADIPNPLRVGRYHSLEVQSNSLPDCLQVEARLEDQTIMAIAHRDLPVVGWQFHPESVLTDHGYQLLANFLCYAGLELQQQSHLQRSELTVRVPRQPDWFQRAIEYPHRP